MGNVTTETTTFDCHWFYAWRFG